MMTRSFSDFLVVVMAEFLVAGALLFVAER
jgi:hypothetical protein